MVSASGADGSKPRRGFGTRQVRHQRLACGFIGLPERGIRQRWDGYKLALIEPGKGSIRP